jgi:hypothetical protein
MLTNGLTVVREERPLPGPWFFQAMMALLPDPGNDGPSTRADATATAPSTMAGRASAARPPLERLANHAPERVWGPTDQVKRKARMAPSSTMIDSGR